MDEQEKARIAKVVAGIAYEQKEKAEQAANQARATLSFIDAWNLARKEVVEPAFIEYAATLATHGIDHQIQQHASAFNGVVGMTFSIGPPGSVGQPKKHVLVKLMPDVPNARITPSYDPVNKPTIVLPQWGINQVSTRNVHKLIGDALEHGGYGR